MATSPFLSGRTSDLPTHPQGSTVLRLPDRARGSGAVSPFAVTSYLAVLRADSGAPARLQHGVDLLPGLVAGCQHASITIVTGERVQVRVASDATSRRADELQGELAEGPTLQAVRTGHSVISHDLSTEARWLAWCSAAVAELPVVSVLSVLLNATQLPAATLNLYSDTVHGLSAVDIGLLHTLAAPLAAALGDGRLDVRLLGPAA